MNFHELSCTFMNFRALSCTFVNLLLAESVILQRQIK